MLPKTNPLYAPGKPLIKSRLCTKEAKAISINKYKTINAKLSIGSSSFR